MPEGPPLAILPSADSPWPADVPKRQGAIGASRTPAGWKWRGYKYDDARQIVLMYAAGPVELEETLGSEYREAGGVLIRRFRLTTAGDVVGLHLLAAAGKQIVAKGAEFAVDDRATVRVESSPAATVTVRESSKRQELLVPVAWKSVNKNRVAEVSIQYEW
jgi:hypothetical protein